MFVAVERRDIAALERFLAEGRDPNVTTEVGYTPLHHAAYHGFEDCVQVLIDAGADVNATNDELMTPLHYASLEGHADVVEVLLAGGADPDIQNSTGETPLLLAPPIWGEQVVVSLLTAGASPNIRDRNGRTPVFRHSHMLELFAAHGADLTVVDSKGKSLLDMASGTPHRVELIERLQREQEGVGQGEQND